jgi:hypothetical protein
MAKDSIARLKKEAEAEEAVRKAAIEIKRSQIKHTTPPRHDQYLADPLGHFLGIPWTARALTDPGALGVVVSDRSRLPSGDMQFVRTVLSGAQTVRACVTYFRRVPPLWRDEDPLSASRALLQGGGPRDGEDPRRPFLLFNVLLDLGEDMCGFKGTLHGGALSVFLDETMCAAADNQSRECLRQTSACLSVLTRANKAWQITR